MTVNQKIRNQIENQIALFVYRQKVPAVRNADEIIILEDGRIAERGTHSELLRKKGLYYQTYMAQYGELLISGEEDGLVFSSL